MTAASGATIAAATQPAAISIAEAAPPVNEAVAAELVPEAGTAAGVEEVEDVPTGPTAVLADEAP